MNKLKTIISGVFITLLLIVVGVFLFSLVPIQGNIKIKIVKSGSMDPTIKTGGIVIIKPSNDYKVGDIITFGIDTKASVPTTHRIVSMREDKMGIFYTTKGDSNEEVDPEEINKNTVIGHVLLTVPFAGFVLDFAHQPMGFVTLIVIPAGLVVLYELLSIIGELKKIKSKKLE